MCPYLFYLISVLYYHGLSFRYEPIAYPSVTTRNLCPSIVVLKRRHFRSIYPFSLGLPLLGHLFGKR